MTVNLSEDDQAVLQGATLLPSRNEQLQYLNAVCIGDDKRLARLSELIASQHNTEAMYSSLVEGNPSNAERSDANERSVGKFRILQPIGSGGMGTVFLAEDTDLHRLIALKIPRAEFLADLNHRRRFFQESRLAAKLQHPGLVTVLEVGTVGTITYIASELCECGDLASWLADSTEPIPHRVAARFVAELCDAVAYMHEHGVLHLDLKPSNILLRKRNNSLADASDSPGEKQGGGRIELADLLPLVSDFGVSRPIDVDATKTNTSLVLGTLLYMSPEQLVPSFGKVSHLSDVYSLGIVLGQILGLEVNRSGLSYREIMASLEDENASSLAIDISRLPDDLRLVLLNCTTAYPDGRYSSAEALARDLRAFACGESVSARTPNSVMSFRHWMNRKSRIKDAWWICLGCNSVALIWMLSGMVLIFGTDFPGSSRTIALASCAGLVATNTIPMYVFSYLGLRGRRWPILPALVLVALEMVLVPAMVLIGLVEAIPGLYDNSPFFESLNHFLVLGFGLVQVAALAIARIASHRHRS